MIGRRISHYQIEEAIGSGGMGDVYLARDLALGRMVALKLLGSRVDEESRRRLLREAQAGRRLQHPGIVTFHEAGEDDGQAFIAMEFVTGITLRRRLQEGGALATADALSLIGGLLEALVHAHAAGIIHRDIKPENILVTDDRAGRLLDFGLAHQLPALADTMARTTPAETRLTSVGQILGTFGYMAPEQLTGEPVDARTDLFALGLVFHESLTGRPTFAAPTVPLTMAATLHAEPGPVHGASADLSAVLARALAKRPDDRHASATEFLRDIRRLCEGRAVSAWPESLAVLEFRNLTGDPNDSWIGSGIADSLLADFGRYQGLSIVSRSRVAAAATDAALTPSALGARLGCRWVLAGSYQRAGDALRVVAELVHVPTDQVTVVEKLDGLMADIFGIQDRLGAIVAAGLKLGESSVGELARLEPTLGAYECYARGLQSFRRLSKGGLDDAQEMFEEALRQEPDYADALAGLAGVHDMRFPWLTDPVELGRAIEHSRRAIAADPGNAAARVWLGYAEWRRGNTAVALTAMTEAAALDPESHYPPYFSGCILMSMGEPESALSFYQRSMERAPEFGFNWLGLGCTHLELGSLAEAAWCLERAIERERTGYNASAGAGGFLGECRRRQQQFDEARRLSLDALAEIERSDHMYRDTGRALCLNTLGRTALDQDDREAARAAFHQCELHLEGRPRCVGSGWLDVQAHAGLAAADRDPAILAMARRRYGNRSEFDWSWFHGCDAGTTERDLERASAQVAAGDPGQ